MVENSEKPQATEAELEAMIAATDTGARSPEGNVGKIMLITAFCWSLFQLWIASPLPYLDFFSSWLPVLNNTDTRSIHLAFAVSLAFLAYPALKSSPRNRIPVQDWVLAFGGIVCTMYLSIFAVELGDRPGLPTTTDLVIGAIGIVLVLEAARRALGPPLMVIALIFLCYVFFGHLGPDIIAWKGASFGKAMSHMWLTQEGVFGVALGVSTSMVFLFVLFGSLLEKAGAGNYFIWVAFSLLGHMKGGPAKAAVVSSALTGLVSGSSIANVVTTGTFTIPLMKRVGFPAEKAGAVEVASSTNGQLTPPVMGAAAFLMIEFVGISYIEVIKHAFLPAIIAYIALVYIVHLEASKAGIGCLLLRLRLAERRRWRFHLLDRLGHRARGLRGPGQVFHQFS
jgi:TRAP transporter 4TM/12TM fusion protein